MRIHNINNIAFKSIYSNLKYMTTDDKLNFICNKLEEIERNQRESLKIITTNQNNINNFNKHGLDLIIVSSAKTKNIAESALENMEYQYKKNQVDIYG